MSLEGRPSGPCLVTGATGLVGNNVLRLLLERGVRELDLLVYWRADGRRKGDSAVHGRKDVCDAELLEDGCILGGCEV